MKLDKSFYFHRAGLAGLFILGNGVIIFPINIANEYSFLGYLISVISSFLFYLILKPFINKIFLSKTANGKLKRLFLKVMSLITTLICFWYAAITFFDFTDFSRNVLLQDYIAIIPLIFFILVLMVFVKCSKESFLKYTLIAFFVTSAIIILFFLLSFENFNVKNAVIFSFPSLKMLYTQIKPYFFYSLLSVFLISVYEVCFLGNIKNKTTVFGIISGFILLGLCILNSLLLFGPDFAATLSYPYASAVSTVTVGRLFTRLDGFSYFVYFASCITKITVCIKLIWFIIKKVPRRN